MVNKNRTKSDARKKFNSLTLFFVLKVEVGASKSAKFIRMLATKPEDPSSIPLAPLGKEKTDSHKLSSYLYT